jgi:NAD-dependent DNA ligase
MNRLIGMVHGVTADRRLRDREILRLNRWIEESAGGALARNWPGSAILGRITEILADGIVTDEERADLLDMLDSLTGGGFEFGAAGGMATTLPVTPVERVNFNGRTFCMTGRFVYGSRARCETAVLQRGGRVLGNVTQKLDYLVIGGLASRDWVQASYGRKIEKAVELREAGRPVVILAEETWASHLAP